MSKICPIHGMEHTVAIKASNHSPGGDLGGQQPDEKFALPTAQDKQAAAPPVTPPPPKAPSKDESDNLFLNKILEDVIIDDPGTRTGTPGYGTPPPRNIAPTPPATPPPPQAQTPPQQRQVPPRPAASNGNGNGNGRQHGDEYSLIDMIDDKFTSRPDRSSAPQAPPEAPKTRRTARTPREQAARAKAAPQPAPKKGPRAKRKSTGKRPPVWMYAAALIPFLILFGVIYQSSSSTDAGRSTDGRSELFAQAEVSYQNGDYEKALSSYQKFISTFPDDPVVPELMNRVTELEQKASLSGPLGTLLGKAQAAMDNSRYLEPANDNAIAYLEQVFAMDAANSAALRLRTEIANHFVTLAEAEAEAENFDQATQYYKNALSVNPDDDSILDKIESSLQLQKIDEMLDNLSELSKTKEDIKALQREKYRLRSQVNQERRKVNGNSDATTGSSPAASTQSTRNNSSTNRPLIQPSTSKSTVGSKEDDKYQANDIENLLGIELLPDDKNGQGGSSQLIIEEGMIDGGKKQYIHREKPNIPSNLQGEDLEMILAECIVGVDGRVESVNVLSGSDNDKLNNLAVTSFKKYRFKPATYRGNPVKFKSIEMMSF